MCVYERVWPFILADVFGGIHLQRLSDPTSQRILNDHGRRRHVISCCAGLMDGTMATAISGFVFYWFNNVMYAIVVKAFCLLNCWARK